MRRFLHLSGAEECAVNKSARPAPETAPKHFGSRRLHLNAQLSESEGAM